MEEFKTGFEEFPRGHLQFKVSRRNFFELFFTHIKTVVEDKHSNGIASLAFLGVLSDQQLAEIAPLVLPDCQIQVDEGFVLACPPQASTAVKLFPVNSPALSVFNQFNGRNFLIDIVPVLMQQTAWDEVFCFAYIRGVFLSLVVAGVCIPSYFTKP